MPREKKPIPRGSVWVVVLAAACTPDPVHRIPRLLDAAVAEAPAPSPSDPAPPPADADPAGANPAPAAVSCGDAGPWKGGEAYAAGKRVTHNTPMHIYECKPWPFSGWCPMAAYEPGKTDAPWTDAWIDLGVCP
jgi:hypothetical protein